MTLDELTQQLDLLESEQRDYCDDCPHCYDCGGSEEFWGAMVHRPEWTCAADGDPEDERCPEHAEYAELLSEIKRVESELAREETDEY